MALRTPAGYSWQSLVLRAVAPRNKRCHERFGQSSITVGAAIGSSSHNNVNRFPWRLRFKLVRVYLPGSFKEPVDRFSRITDASTPYQLSPVCLRLPAIVIDRLCQPAPRRADPSTSA